MSIEIKIERNDDCGSEQKGARVMERDDGLIVLFPVSDYATGICLNSNSDSCLGWGIGERYAAWNKSGSVKRGDFKPFRGTITITSKG